MIARSLIPLILSIIFPWSILAFNYFTHKHSTIRFFKKNLAPDNHPIRSHRGHHSFTRRYDQKALISTESIIFSEERTVNCNPKRTCSLDLSSAGWMLLSIQGKDRLRFLHGISSSSFLDKTVTNYGFTNALNNKVVINIFIEFLSKQYITSFIICSIFIIGETICEYLLYCQGKRSFSAVREEWTY